MAEVTQKIIDASRRADARLAGRDTPFLFDCWYVAGFAWEFERELRARTILARPLVLFRTQDGAPVALSHRCVHRSYPLSKSRLDGDTIVCGYHGMRYDADGHCIEAPALHGDCPRGVGVRYYPLHEQGPLAFARTRPAGVDLDGQRRTGGRSTNRRLARQPTVVGEPAIYHLKASYVALHENLLDLTHLSFLHAGAFGTPDFAMAPYEIALDEQTGSFRLKRIVKPTRLPRPRIGSYPWLPLVTPRYPCLLQVSEY